MALYHLKRLGAVSFIFGMKYPVISLSIFDRLLEPVFFFAHFLLSIYHQLTRANTPAGMFLRHFLPFSSWRVPARLRLKSQKSLENPSPIGAEQFCRSRNVFRRQKAHRECWRISKGFAEARARFCPSKPYLPLSIDGIKFR